jgi:hypothetical protein
VILNDRENCQYKYLKIHKGKKIQKVNYAKIKVVMNNLKMIMKKYKIGLRTKKKKKKERVNLL